MQHTDFSPSNTVVCKCSFLCTLKVAPTAARGFLFARVCAGYRHLLRSHGSLRIQSRSEFSQAPHILAPGSFLWRPSTTVANKTPQSQVGGLSEFLKNYFSHSYRRLLHSPLQHPGRHQLTSLGNSPVLDSEKPLAAHSQRQRILWEK